MKKRNITLILLFLLLIFASAGITYHYYVVSVERPSNLNEIDYATAFNDYNQAHLKAAKRYGLPRPPKNRKEAEKHKQKLVRITNNEFYSVDRLTHSIPYLTNGASEVLNTIGKNFQDSLASKGLPKYKIIVTSVLRTKEDINKLRNAGNPNAVKNSAHCHATTYDITYARFKKQSTYRKAVPKDILKNVLGEVLRDLRKNGKCFVKHEKKQMCFHITARQ